MSTGIEILKYRGDADNPCRLDPGITDVQRRARRCTPEGDKCGCRYVPILLQKSVAVSREP